MEPNRQNPMPSTMNTTPISPVSSPAAPISVPIAPMSSPIAPSTSTASSTASSVSDSSHKKVGPIIATLVVVLVLIIAALYLFASKVNKEPVPVDTMTTAVNNVTAASPTVAPVTSSSDDPVSLQSDLNASTNNLDTQNF